MLALHSEIESSNPIESHFFIFLNFMVFKLAVTQNRENPGTKTHHKILQIYPEKLGISMNRACPRVLSFLFYLVKSGNLALKIAHFCQ